jgi:hypothetical protein
VKIGDWHGAEDARRLIQEAIDRATRDRRKAGQDRRKEV